LGRKKAAADFSWEIIPRLYDRLVSPVPVSGLALIPPETEPAP
jgi:hypothetical protein